MAISRTFQIACLIFLWSILSSAQTASEKSEKQSKLKVQLEQVATDTAKLKLPENKALVYAELGNIFWKFDEKRARQLFQTSIDNLIIAQKEAELDKKSYVRRNDLLIFGGTRRKILESIVYHDAKLAFDLLRKSRSVTVIDAFAGISNEPSFSSYNGVSSDEMIVQQENLLERNLTELVANQNPDRSVNILRDLLRKNISYKTVELLEKISQKEKAAATALTAEILEKILAADFSDNSPELQAAAQFLTAAAKEDFAEFTIKFDAKTQRDLAEKIVAFLIREADRKAEFSISYLTPTLIKILPERAAEIKEKIIMPRRSSRDIFPQNKQAEELLQSNTSPEKLLSEADKFPPAFREQIYVTAANKIALDGDVSRAKDILTKNFPVRRRDEMFAALHWQLAYRAIEKGDFEQARTWIEQLPESSRFEVLINLAASIISKSPNDREKAVSILKKAQSLIPTVPSNLAEIYKTGQLAAVYALIEPTTGFGLLDSIIGKIAEISESDVIVKNFRGDSNVSQGEFIINSGFLFSGFSEIQVSLDKLTRIDFEKTLQIVNKIQRRDVRIALQLQVLKTASSN